MSEPSWRDKHGDIWTYNSDDGLLHTPETRPFDRAFVEKKWGPLVAIPAVPLIPKTPEEETRKITIRELFEIIREVKEAAWQEGREGAIADAHFATGFDERKNPHSKDT